MPQFDSRQILQCLAEGVDPTTGAALPADTVLRAPEVIAALQAASAALASEAERARRRAQLPANLGLPWSKAEELTLVSAFHTGTTLGDIAKSHGRTLAAIEARLERLGLLSAQQRATRNRYVSAPPRRAPEPTALGVAAGGSGAELARE